MYKITAFSFIEILISLSIISVALLGLVRLQMMTLSYQNESALLAKAANVISDVMLAQSHQDAAVYAQQSAYVRFAFPQGQLNLLVNKTHLSLQWKLPQLPLFQLTFTEA